MQKLREILDQLNKNETVIAKFGNNNVESTIVGNRKRKTDYRNVRYLTSTQPTRNIDKFYEYVNNVTEVEDLDKTRIFPKTKQRVQRIINKIEECIIKRANPKVTKSISKQVIGDLDLEEWEELKLRWEQYIVAIKKTKTYELSFKGFKKSGSIEVLTFHPNNLPPLYHDVWFVKKWIQAEEMDKGNYGERMYLALITRLQVNWSPFTELVRINFKFHTWYRNDEDCWDLI